MSGDGTRSSTLVLFPLRSTALPACLLAGGLLLAALASTPLGAQADFRRGDANADGVVDVSDAIFVSRYLFRGDATLSCLSAADTDDSGDVNLTDEVRILNVLFLGIGTIPPPGPGAAGPDPTPDGLACPAYEPAAPPKHADLDLGFECLGPDPSGPGRYRVAATLTTRNNTAGEGAEAWSLSIGAEGYQVLSATTAGTAAALTTDTPPGYRDPNNSFNWPEVIDPARIVDGVAQGPGAVAAVQLAIKANAQIPAEGTERLLILTVEEDPPGGPGPHRLFFAGGKLGAGEPVKNVITIRGASQAPNLGTLESCIVDCNSNGTPDEVDILAGTSKDCDESFVPDECEIADGTHPDCNSNAIPDSCDIAAGTSRDCDQDGIPDDCGPDCNSNGVADPCDIAAGTSHDCNSNGIPDSCDGSEDPNDCNGNGKPDRCDITSGTSQDCNSNGIPDSCDLAAGTSDDCDQDGVPDDCQPDCNSNGRADACDISTGESDDDDQNGIPDECGCTCACPSAPPLPCEPGAGPKFRLGFRGDCENGGNLRAFATLDQFCLPAGNRGAQGWSFGVAVLVGTPLSATTSGTATAPTTEGGFRNPTRSFEKTVVIDPAKNGGQKGVVTAVALSTGGAGTYELPPAAHPYDILQLEVELATTGSCSSTTLEYMSDLVGAGQPTPIVITFEGESHAAVLSEATWRRCSGGSQRPGDANQDGSTDIADPIWLLGHLFLGTFPVLPCDGGTAIEPGPGGLALLDWSGDGSLDLTDPISLLNHLFSSGPPHPLGAGCVSIEGCPDMCAP